MASVARMHVPDDLRYSTDHEWISRDGDILRVGITDYAQDALGDVVFVQVPSVGATVNAWLGGKAPGRKLPGESIVES